MAKVFWGFDVLFMNSFGTKGSVATAGTGRISPIESVQLCRNYRQAILATERLISDKSRDRQSRGENGLPNKTGHGDWRTPVGKVAIRPHQWDFEIWRRIKKAADSLNIHTNSSGRPRNQINRSLINGHCQVPSYTVALIGGRNL